MPDRYALELHTSVASNTRGPYTYAWDRVIVPEAGVVRSVAAVALSLTSNTIKNSVDVYRQADAPAAGSNTALSILTSPITLYNDRDVEFGVPDQPGSLLTAGDVLEVRTYSDTAGAASSFRDLDVTVVVERTA